MSKEGRKKETGNVSCAIRDSNSGPLLVHDKDWEARILTTELTAPHGTLLEVCGCNLS